MKKILLVNKNEAFLDRNSNLLSRSGFRIFTARSGADALAIHRREMVHVMVAGLNLLDMGGDEFCEILRRDEELKRVSVVIICFPTAHALHRATHCGANAVLTKPVQPNELLDQVSRFASVPTRREHRVRFHARLQGVHGSLPFSGISHNISVSGILCETDTPLSHDDLITISCPVESHRIVADGRVVRAAMLPEGKFNYGVEFVRMAPECREGIARFVAASADAELERACG